MDINLKNAVNKFYPNPSLEMVYFEAIANSIDAGATEIQISISVDSLNKPETLEIVIIDDGEGFTNDNFRKFGTLLEHQDKFHKGLGRLVYLQYFNYIDIDSCYGSKKRTFRFDKDFKKESTIVDVEEPSRRTEISFSEYYRGSIRSYAYILPKDLAESVKLQFYPILYSRKLSKKDLKITFTLSVEESNPKVGFVNYTETINSSDLPDLKSISVKDEKLDLFSEVVLYYQIERNYKKTSIITAINADGRTIELDLLTVDDIPQGYEMFFLFSSSYFDGKATNTREEIDIDKNVLDKIKKIFKDQLRDLLRKEVPEIAKRNKEILQKVRKQYPFLNGYVVDNMVGLANRDFLIDEAERKFFEDQKIILEAESLSDSQYEKALKLSSRVLAEYIIYRQKIIDKLKSIDIGDSETEIHEIIVPTKTVLSEERFFEDIYKNNIWLLDDKFMTYSTILSELEMKKLIPYIKLDEESDDETRPDIAIVFAKNPTKTEKLVDVVIVELKKLGLNLAKREEVVSQLRQRARKLLNYYPNQIGRIWFYGIVDIDKEFRISLKENGFIPVYSEDQIFYNEQKIIVDEENDIVVPIGLNIMSYDALMMDADARNSTFLKILIDSIGTFSENSQKEYAAHSVSASE